MLTRIALAVLSTALCVHPASASDAVPPATLIGSWLSTDAGVPLALELAAGGRGNLAGAPFTWHATSDTLTLVIDGESVAYGMALSGDTLRLSGADLPMPLTFQRQGAAAPTPPPTPPTAPGATPDKPAKPSKPAEVVDAITGTWATTQGGASVVLELGPDHAGRFNNGKLTWQRAGNTLTITAANGQSMAYRVALSGDALTLSGADLPAPLVLKRRVAATGIADTWVLQANGQSWVMTLGADGAGTLNGGPFRWTYAKDTLTVKGPDGQTTLYRAVLKGDELEVSGGALTAPATLHRQGSAAAGPPAPPTGVTGVWSSTESSVDPSIVMIITQYITLWPDGTVSFQKTEGGSSISAINDNWSRFRSWHEGGAPAGNAGRWESDGQTITVSWRYWNNLVSRGQVDLAKGKLSLSGMGILDEGRTLVYTRE